MNNFHVTFDLGPLFALKQEIEIGTQAKAMEGIGKEYYALSCGRGDTIIQWVEQRVEALLPEFSGKPYNVHNVCFDLQSKHVFKPSKVHTQLVYIHKKRLKRFLKKAVQRALW